MIFVEAIKAIQDGKYVTRNAWNDGSYLVFLPGMQYIWQVKTVPNPAAGNWLPMLSDILADDWKAIETYVKPEIPE